MANAVRLLNYVRFGELEPGERFRWGRWFEGQSTPDPTVYVRMKGNRYKAPDGKTYVTGARTAVERVRET
jgi:hypothetical protein